MAKMGVRNFQELIGRTDMLKVVESKHPKAKYLDFSSLLKNALWMRPGVNIVGGSVPQDFELEKRLDNQLLAMTAPVLEGKQSRVDIEMAIENSCRTFATTLSYYIAKYAHIRTQNMQKLRDNEIIYVYICCYFSDYMETKDFQTTVSISN